MMVNPTISKYLNEVLILHKFWDGIHTQASLKISKDTCFSLFCLVDFGVPKMQSFW